MNRPAHTAASYRRDKRIKTCEMALQNQNSLGNLPSQFIACQELICAGQADAS